MGALASRLCGWCDDESAGDNGKAGAAPPAPSFEAEGGEGRVKDVSEALEREIDCDYLVVGAGACSLSFVDTLLAEMPGLRIAIVDKHDAPGGHWNDAYDFVRLHQPSLFYGLASRQLEGSWLWLLLRGMMPFHHRAGKHEILGMFKAAVHAWVRAGKVRYYPSCAFDFAHAKKHPNGPHRFTSLDGTAEYAATVAMKVVDGTLGEPLVPSTQPLPFPVDKGIDVLTPNDLPHLRKKHSHYVVLGCGKTGMDSCVYLQRKMGVDPKDISLVIPNDIWMYNRYPPEYWKRGGPYDYLRKYLEFDGDFDETCLAMEKEGLFFRYDPDRLPTKLRHPIIDESELELLRKTRMVRRGRVSGIQFAANKKDVLVKFGPDYLPLAVKENAAFVHCCSPGPFTGDWIKNGRKEDIFASDNLLRLLIIFHPPVSLPSACVAYLEAAAQRGSLALNFARDLAEGPDLSAREALMALFRPWPIDNRGMKEQLSSFVNLALFMAVSNEEPADTLKWLRGSRLSLFSSPAFKSNIVDLLGTMVEKREKIGFDDRETRMLLKVRARLEHLGDT